MTSIDLFVLIGTLALVFVSAFLCVMLFWLIRIFRIWSRLSEDVEQNIHQCADRFSQALHTVTSFKAVADIGMQTLQTVMAVYQKKTGKGKAKKKEDE